MEIVRTVWFNPSQSRLIWIKQIVDSAHHLLVQLLLRPK